MMIKLSEHDLVIRSVATAESAREVKGQCRHVGAKHDFGRACVQKIGQHLPSRVDDRVGFLAGGIGPVGIGVVMIKIIIHCLDHRAWHLRAAGSIEISDRITVMNAGERWEASAYFFELLHRGILGSKLQHSTPNRECWSNGVVERWTI